MTETTGVGIDGSLLRFVVMAGRAPVVSSSTTRRSILTHAISLFADQGYAATSMRSIATASGIRAPSIYEHFDNKSALLHSALTEVLGDFHRYIADVVDPDLPVGEQLRRILVRHSSWQLKFSESAGAWDTLAATSTVAAELGPETLASFTAQRSLYLQLVEEIVALAHPGDLAHERARAATTLCDRVSSWTTLSPDAEDDEILAVVWPVVRHVVAPPGSEGATD